MDLAGWWLSRNLDRTNHEFGFRIVCVSFKPTCDLANQSSSIAISLYHFHHSITAEISIRKPTLIACMMYISLYYTKVFSRQCFTGKLKVIDFMIDVIIAPNPVNELKNYLKGEEYFTALALAVQDFEHYGMHALNRHLKDKEIKINTRKRIKSCHQLIVLLRACDIIPEEIYQKMLDVNSFRGKVIHKLGKRITMDKTKAKKMIEKAIECLSFLEQAK